MKDTNCAYAKDSTMQKLQLEQGLSVWWRWSLRQKWALNLKLLQSLSRVILSATAWATEHQASLSITNSWSLLKFRSITSVIPSKHLFLCHPLLHPPSIFHSIGVFSNELVLQIKWPMYCSFSFSVSPSNEYSGLISFRMDWLDLL